VTPLLWVAEGITDYYAHVILTRAGLWGENEFLQAVRSWIISVEGQSERQAVEDASVDTWIDPQFGNRYLYYDNGALLGLLLDIEIREATQDLHSLDDVMRILYREHFLKGRGFDTSEFLTYLGEFVGEAAVRDFYRDFVDGRDPPPYRDVLAAAALDFRVDTIVEPFLGVRVGPDREGRMIVREVLPGSSAEEAGLRFRDHLKWVGSQEIVRQDWGNAFKRAYSDSIGVPVTVVYERGGKEFRRDVAVRTQTRYEYYLSADETAGERQIERRRRILEGG
jgi:predicted metalloprotease with PDZ domain